MSWQRAARILATALASFAIGCSRDPRPNLVLVTLDTTRADRLGTYGDAAARTPVLDALAAEGVVFERAYASAPLTLPSHTTLLTGLDPNRHGIHDNGHFVVPASLETLAERLAAGGYASAAFVAAFVLDSRFGLDQGFGLYDDEIPRAQDPLDFGVASRRGGEVTDRALAWLRASDREPFFLWVHYYDVHAPRRPPAPFDAGPDAYAAAVSYVDAEVGRLRDGLRTLAGDRETLLLVVADHGESLGEHAEPTHGVVAYDSTLHVPLIAVGPGFDAGRRSKAFVTTADVAPTLLAAAGAPEIPAIDGRSLQGAREDVPQDRVTWFETYGPHFEMGWSSITGVRNARWKLTREPDPIELYDLETDPHELENRAAAERDVVAGLSKAHARLAPPDPLAPVALSEETSAQLAALGYATSPGSFAPGEAPDPREFVEARGLVDIARSRALHGHVADAIRVLELLAERPVVRVQSLQSLVAVYGAAGRTADAVRAAEQVLELSRTDWARFGLVDALLRDGQPEAALATLEAGSTASRPSRRWSLARAQAWVEMDRIDEALAELAPWLDTNPPDDETLALASRALAIRDGARQAIDGLRARIDEPQLVQLPQTASVLATLLRLEGRLADARQLMESLGSEDPSVLVALALVAKQSGDAERAAELYESALQTRPAALAWRRELADLYGSLGRKEAALAQYDLLIAADPANAELWLDRGVERLRSGETAAGERDLRKALALDGRLAAAHFNLGLVEAQRGHEQDAEAHFLAAVAILPDYAKAHLNLARIYRLRHDPRAGVHAEAAARASRSPTGDPGRAPAAGR